MRGRGYHSAHLGTRGRSESAPSAALACPSRGAVRATLGGVGGGRGRCGSGSGGRPHLRRGRAVMAYSTVQRVALASGLVLAVSLLLPKAFLSRGKRQEPPPAPEGKRGPTPPPRAAGRARAPRAPLEGGRPRGSAAPRSLRGAKRQGSLGSSGQRPDRVAPGLRLQERAQKSLDALSGCSHLFPSLA